jgi:general secretion pathway protein G
MYVPSQVKRLTHREKKRALKRIAREAERQRMRMFVPDAAVGRKPYGVILLLLLMVLVGVPLVRQARMFRFQPQPKPDPRVVAREELSIFRTALDDFWKDCGRYPAAQDGLEALIHNPGLPRWQGPYLNAIKSDPWKRRYLYEMKDGRITVISRGPDGIKGSADDLTAEAAVQP